MTAALLRAWEVAEFASLQSPEDAGLRLSAGLAWLAYVAAALEASHG